MLNNISWTVDLSATNIAPMRMQILHGEDLAISVRVLQSGVAMDLSTASATLFWQSAGMGEDWYSDDCAIIENVITTAWLHGNDSGADRYVFYVRLVLDGVVSYRVYGIIDMLYSPNFIPNEVSLPTRVLDFAEVTLLNVPYALTTELNTHAEDTTTNPHGITPAMIGALRLVGDVADGDMIVLSGDSGELARSGGQPVSIADVSGIVSDAVSDGVSEHDSSPFAHTDIRGLISGLTLDVIGLSGSVGDIGSILDAINGEVI